MKKEKGSKKINDDCYEIIAVDENSSPGENKFVSEDVTITAQKGKVALKDFPHPRHLCGNLPFATTSHEIYCAECYCLVCGTPAPKCQQWRGSDGHCHITQKIDKVKIDVPRVEESYNLKLREICQNHQAHLSNTRFGSSITIETIDVNPTATKKEKKIIPHK